MSTYPASERWPLTGADCFLRAFDAETRRWNRASHLSQLVLRLGPGFQAEAFHETLRSVVDAHPVLRAPIRRVAGVGEPVYRLDRAIHAPCPPVQVHRHAAGERAEIPVLFYRRLNERWSGARGELLRVDAVRHGGNADAGPTDLAFTWLHMLFDGAGSERFVAFLETCGLGRRAVTDVSASDRPGGPPDLVLPASLRERGRMARTWQAWMDGLGARGTRSLAGPLRSVRQDLIHDRRVFPPGTSAEITGRARALAGFMTPMLFYLAAAIRAHHAVLRRRGAVPESYVVPLPVNLRPKGGEGAMFRTRVSMLWFQVASALAEDLDALLGELKQQRRRAIRERQVENGVAAMDFARFAPCRLYSQMARRALRGELCSFFFAWTDAFCPDVQDFFGAPVLDGFHAPAVPPSPGSSLVFSLRGECLHATHVRQRGLMDDRELALFREQLERDLTGAG